MAARSLRARALARCAYYAAVPWWIYEAEKHHRGTHLQHARENLVYAWCWLRGAQSPAEEAFEMDNAIVWPRLRMARALDAVSVLWMRLTRRCPTCGERGPDTVDRVGDYGGEMFEARCGDPWHDKEIADAV